ncbi:MAG: hypothetical protein HQL37_15680 [Alphaproteobacteria bacterium]|nr:hypothetical protein [Alphaproteobacteria bacterium]
MVQWWVVDYRINHIFDEMAAMETREILATGVHQGLQLAAKSAIISHVFRGIGSMVAVRKPAHITPNDDSVFDDADALIALAQKSFTKAAKRAVAENDTLGIPSPGSVNGQIVFRTPPPKATP